MGRVSLRIRAVLDVSEERRMLEKLKEMVLVQKWKIQLEPSEDGRNSTGSQCRGFRKREKKMRKERYRYPRRSHANLERLDVGYIQKTLCPVLTSKP